MNDKINVRLNGEKIFRSGYIDEINDSSLFLDGDNIPLSKVNAILVDKNKSGSALLRSLSTMLPIGGAVIIGLAAANSVINNDYPLIPKNTYYVAGGMAAVGLLLYPFTFRVYRIKHHPLKIMDASISAQ
ncbi:MAG: hypothetical protein JJE25_07130 [Bacteroidia bacterium]|nr:hypothetical protein [Bacteroidia bacterium]